MNMDSANETTGDNLDPTTAPATFQVVARGFATEKEAQELGMVIGECVRQLSRVFDLCGLDGVTVAYDYPEALLELDRGYTTNHKLTPTIGHVIGVAMTPSVIRNHLLKSHIVLNAYIVEPILDHQHQAFQLVLHTIAHECAHVEVTHKFDTAFPGFLLKKQHVDVRDGFRWQTILACWDEYAVTNLSGLIGETQTDKYEENLLQYLEDARDRADSCIRAYRTHSQLIQVYTEVYGIYGELLKFASYYLGDLDCHGLLASEREGFATKLFGHWFEPFFLRLHNTCKDLAKDYGKWQDLAAFEVIGDIADDLVALGGIKARYLESGVLYLDIPFTPDTVPH